MRHRLWPAQRGRERGANPPDASNLNFSAGQTIPNSVVAEVGAGGKVCVFTSAPAHLLVDVGGYTKA